MLIFLHKKRIEIITFSILLTVLILAFTLEPVNQMLAGYKNILISPSVLLTDYLLVGGLAATLFNVFVTIFVNLVLLKFLKVKITGSVFACLLTIAGFSFFGKNFFNALPMYLGVYFYTLATKTHYKDHIPVILLSSGISPVVSFLIFGLGLPLGWGIVIGISVGILIGFILPGFNVYTLKFHQGYNLYNTGFSMGVISMFITGILGSFNLIIPRGTEVDNSYHSQLLIAIMILSSIFIILAFIDNPKVLKKYHMILKESGKLVTDFVEIGGKDATILNIGIMGLLCIVLIKVINIQISGPVMGAVLTVLGFSALGKHPLNSIPVMLGAIIAIEITPYEWTIGTTLSVLFVTGLAPIAGKFGIIAGIIAGFIHLLVTPLALDFQGGFDLYNNGFAAGFVAAVLVPVFNTLKKSKNHIRLKE